MGVYTGMYTEILARISEMERSALFSLKGNAVDSTPYFPFKGQEGYPYWTNRLGSATYTQDEYGMDMLHITRSVFMRLVTSNADSGYNGENQTEINQFIGDFVLYIHEPANAWLKTTTYPTAMQWLEQPIRLVSDTGIIAFQGGGSGSLQVGIEFVIELDLNIQV